MPIHSTIQQPRRFAAGVLCLAGLFVPCVWGDDSKINTPVVAASLRGDWELQPKGSGEYKQTLHLGPQLTGTWQQSRHTLPVSIAWFVEGGELRILHYFEPDEAFNYRVKTIMASYKLTDDALTLTIDGEPSLWNRSKEDRSPQPGHRKPLPK